MGIYDGNTVEAKTKKSKRPLTKKKKIILSVVAIILVIALCTTFIFMRNGSSSSSNYAFIRTTTLSKGTLEDSFSATGTVKSAQTSNVTTSLSYPIKSVLVSVGDEVKEGDVIATLDSSDLEVQIEREQKNISSSLTQAQSSYDSAKSSYNTAKEGLSSASTALEDAKNEYTPAKSNYNNAVSAVKSYQSAYDSALKSYENAGAKYVKAQKEYDNAVSSYNKGSISADKLISVAKAYMSAVQNYSGGCNTGSYEIAESSSSANTQQGQIQSNSSSGVQITQTANDICNSVVSKIKNLTGKSISYSSSNGTLYKLSQKLTALKNAKTTCNYYTIESTYSSAKSQYDSAKQSVEQAKSQLEQAKTQLQQAKAQLENASSSDSLEELQDQLNNCCLKAEQDGTVTSLNATIGSSAMGGSSVATISNLDSLIVSITIAEANINNAVIGMSCYITSDASDETLTGTLTQIDPVANETGAFGAEVTVESSGTSLKVGMNASVELLVSSKDDVFQVPIDAVGNDDSGDFVYRYTSGEGTDMQFEKIYVEKGESNDYYVEINSSELAEGDVIRSSSDLTQGIETGETKKTDSSSIFSSLFGGGNSGRPNMDSGMSSGSKPGYNGSQSFGGNMPTPPSGGFNG
ncbi:efflux RND transporter periplasmic adaptor subunit [Eubacterium sp.]|uniref:efflux RND transporter periplasmic adaptor subunit n=1 Tax=Eubacterium sp. TaxID=142586 RepID=UPI003F02698E